MQKRILSAILSLSIVASLFAGLGFSASAAPASSTLIPDEKYGNFVYARNQSMSGIASDASWDCNPTKSLVRGKVPEKVYYYVNESYKTDATSTLNGATDVTFGEIATDAVSSAIVDLTSTTDFNNDTRIFNSTRLQGGMFVAGGALVNDETKQYLQINFELDGKATIDSFFFGSDRGTAGAYQPGHWKVYIADTEDALFEEANCVAETDMVDGMLYRTIKTELATPKSGKWVGLRIISAYRTVPGSVYPRIDHFSVQGTYDAPVTSANAEDYSVTVEGADSTAVAEVINAELAGNTDRNDAYGAVGVQLYTTGDYVSDDGKAYQFKGWYNNGVKVADTAEATCLADALDSKTYVAKYGVPTYTVTFVANGTTIDTQAVEYGAAAKAPIAPNVSGYIFNGWDKDFSNITGDLTVTAQYIKPTYTSAISSGYTDEMGNKVYARNKDLTSLVSDATWDVAPAESLVRGKVPEKVYYYINESYKDDASSKLSTASGITFGKRATDEVSDAMVDLTSTTDFNNDTQIFNNVGLQTGMFVAGGVLVNDEDLQYLQFNFELDGKATIDSFIFGSDRATAGAYHPGHWKFYIADTEDGLFDETNCVAEMDMTSQAAYRTAKTVLATPKAGKWIGVRLICAYKTVPGTVSPKIDHFSVQGVYTDPVYNAEKIAVNVAKDAAVADVDGISVSKSDIIYGNSDRIGSNVAKVTVTANDMYIDGDTIYTFTGWYNGDNKVADTAVFDYDLANGAANLVAKYDIRVREKFTVTYMNGEEVYATFTVSEGDTIAVPELPETVGYTNSWSEDLTDVAILKNYTITLNSVINKYTVTFVGNGGAALGSQEVEHGKAAIAPNAKVSGYAFLGWDKDFSKVTGDLTVTGNYVKITYQSAISGTVDIKNSDNKVYARNKAIDDSLPEAWDVQPSKSLILNKTPAKAYYFVDESFIDDENSYFFGNEEIKFGERTQAPVSAGANLLTDGSNAQNESKIIGNATLQKGMFVEYADGIESNPTGTIDNEDLQYLQINYELDGEASIEVVELLSKHMGEAWSVKHWKVYVADTEEGLFVENNCVSEINMEGKNYRTAKTVLSTPVTGKWVGLRVISAYMSTPTTTDVYPRLAEFSVRGTYTTPINISDFNNVAVTVEKDATVESVDEIEVSASAADFGATDEYGRYADAKVTVTATAKFENEDYTYEFAGWSKDGEIISTDAVFEYDLADGAANLVATYTATSNAPEITYYTVTFLGFDGAELKTESVEEGQAATAPEAPEVEGYDFTGWDAEFDNITGDLTVNAIYTIKTFTVTFVDWNGTELKKETVNYGAGATAPADPEREDYTFTGWDVAFDNITGDITVTAQYAIDTYTVTFVDWNGTVLGTDVVEAGSAATAPADPVRVGYDFTGWDKAFDSVSGDLTVTAQYTIKTFTVTFVGFGGAELKEETVEYGAAATAPEAPVVDGYNFTGWDVAYDNIIADLTVTAQYTIKTFTVTFVGFGGAELKEETVEYGAAATAPEAPAVEGYNFTGWDVAFDNITGDLTVTAQYTIKSFTVTFVGFGGAELDTQTVDYGAGAIAPVAPSVEGYDFTGWDVAYDNITGDLTVTAQYTIKSFTVTFIGFGGEELKKETVNYGAAATAPTDIDVPGFEFTGWDKAFDNITGDLTVTAEYKEIFYTVTLKDAKGVLAEFTVKAGESVPDVMAIEASISDVYGYTVMKDDNDRVIWNGDVTAPIGADTTFEVRYQRDDSLKTAVTVTLVDGTKVYDNATLAYDTAIVAEDASATAWLMDGVVVATGSSLKLYACGGTMNIVATTDAQAALDVAIVGKVVEGNQFSVFAHVNAADVKSYGIIFASGSYGEDNIELDYVAANPTKLKVTQADANGKTDFMATLVQSKAIGTKYARAFVVYADNTVAYSNVVVSQ